MLACIPAEPNHRGESGFWHEVKPFGVTPTDKIGAGSLLWDGLIPINNYCATLRKYGVQNSQESPDRIFLLNYQGLIVADLDECVPGVFEELIDAGVIYGADLLRIGESAVKTKP